MPRGSDIDRAGVGADVIRHAASGDTPSMISASIGHDISSASVRRYLAKQSANAAIVPERNITSEMVMAAISGLADTRDTGVSSYFGKYQLNTINNFTRYYGLARGIGNGQVMRAFKNIALKITNGAKIVGDEKDAEKIATMTKTLNFSSLLQNVTRYTCEMGTCLVGMKSKNQYIPPSILPIQYYTLLTDAETPGTVEDGLVHGIVTQVVFDEMGDEAHTFDRDEIGLLRLWEDGNELQDISGRSTFGIYGESMTIGVETPLKSLLNSSYYYDEFIKRYGLGRLHINLKTLADMIKDGAVNATAAQAAQDADTAAIQKLGPNEDIISAGREVSMIESKTGFDIVPYLEWRRKQIDRALLQSDVGAGDVGSSWTSAGTAVSAQDYDTFKSLRETIFEQFMTEIIVPRCEEFSLKSETLSIAATPFLQVDVPFQTITEWVKLGLISEGEARGRGGFPEIKPDSE